MIELVREEDIKKAVENSGKYSSPVSITQQFRHCGNPLRLDLYKGCSFLCNYCFAANKNTKFNDRTNSIVNADFKQIKRLFYNALETDKEFKDFNIEAVRRRVPIHVGGNSDPFQHIEFTERGGLTKALIELSNKYDYPLTFSTKAASLPDEYIELLDPTRHAFQCSVLGLSDEFIRKYEKTTPMATERVQFLKKLHDKGFWTAIRIQPLIDLDEALALVKYAGELGAVDYITVEHLKIALDNKKVLKIFESEAMKTEYYIPLTGARNYEVQPSVKEKNFKAICDLANSYGIKVGCGDNDMHHLTQSRCCCGIDTIPGGKFDNWMKYNLTYFSTGEYDLNDEEAMWTPSTLYSLPNAEKERRHEKIKTFKEWTKDYILKNKHLAMNAGKPEIISDISPETPIQTSLF